jgi:hypothetical protein
MEKNIISSDVPMGDMKKTRMVSMIAVFAALNVVFDAIIIPQFSSGVWFGLVYLIVPITGIVLGPYAGFLSTLMGVFVGHAISPRGVEEFLFTFGAPLGAMISGMLFQKKWKLVFIYYTVLLLSYFITPTAWQLPIWGMWDVYGAYLVLLITMVFIWLKGDRINPLKNDMFLYGFCAFIGLEADILFRIFVFIPGQTYQSIYGLPLGVLQEIWVAGALITPFKVAISTIITALLGSRLASIYLRNE